jgi:ABC-type branched-subunit amino acid transport system substrate-binding protein
MRSARLAVVLVLALLAWPPGPVSGQGTPRPATGGALRLGALVPLTGPGAWFGTEIKQGLELAAAELDPNPRERSGDGTFSSESPARAADGSPRAEPRTATEPRGASREAAGGGEAGADSSGEPGETKPEGPPPEPVEAPDRRRTVALALQVLDVPPADVRAAESGMNRLLATGVTVVMTASPTPTLAAFPLAARRDVLVAHAGLPTDRLPAPGRTLLQLRPSVGARAEILAAYAGARGIKRLALVAGGDDFGRAVRAGVGARWRKQGGHLVHEESLSLDAADRRSRLRAVARAGPEAVALGYQGAALGEAARALRDAGYQGQLLAADDDRAALFAGGPALDGARLLADAFVAIPGTRGARFARAYEARHGQPPSRFAASAYEAAVLLTDATSAAMRAGTVSGSRLREALVAARGFPSLYAGDVVVRDDGTFARPLALFRVEGDRLTFEGYVGVDGRALGP